MKKANRFLILVFVLVTAGGALRGMWDHPEGIPAAWDWGKFLVAVAALVVSGAGVLVAICFIAAAENLRRKNDAAGAGEYQKVTILPLPHSPTPIYAPGSGKNAPPQANQAA